MRCCPGWRIPGRSSLQAGGGEVDLFCLPPPIFGLMSRRTIPARCGKAFRLSRSSPFGKKPQGVPPSPPSPPPVSGKPNGASPPSAEGDLSWGWWSVSLLVEWAVGRVFSTRSHPGSASTRGGWAGYVIDRSGLWMFGNFWPAIAWSVLSVLAVGALVGLAWALRTLRQVCCCCCRRGEHSPVEGGAPPGAVPAPRVAADLPSLAVAKGFVSLELTGPDAPMAVDTEYYQRKIRGRGVGRKPHDVVIKLDQRAARLQPTWDGGSRIDRTGLLVHYSRVLGVTDRRLREELEREGSIHLCRQRECSHPALLHCRCYAAVDSEALVDLGAHGRFSAWRASVLLARLSRSILGGLLFWVRWVWRGNIALRRPSRAGAGPRQIQERGVLRSLDPESESEAEVLEDPCQAVQVGLELQGVVKALAVEDCTDRAAAEPTRLLERDSELSDLGGSRTARLCNHHSQLYMMSCQGRKCSVLSCYGAVHGAHRGAPLCRKHLAETARSLSPASTGPRTPRSQTKDSFDLTSTLRTSHAKVEPRAVRFESAAEAVGVPPRSREPSPPRPCAPKPPPAYLEPLTPLEQRVAVPAGEPVLLRLRPSL